MFKTSSFSNWSSLSVIKPEKGKESWKYYITKFGRKQNVLGDMHGTSEDFLRKRQLQIWGAKSVVNIYLEKLEVPKNILNPTVQGCKSHLL